MPTYEYKCKKCNKIFEEFQSINEDPLKKCIHCGAQVNRVFHPVGVIYKGTGFYTTDYKKKEQKADKTPKPKEKKKEKATSDENKKSTAATNSK